jgi:hypothetical protein
MNIIRALVEVYLYTRHEPAPKVHWFPISQPVVSVTFDACSNLNT